MLDIITEVNSTINGFVWGLPMMVLILGVGLYLSVRCGFPQFLHFGHIMKNTLGKAFQKAVGRQNSERPTLHHDTPHIVDLFLLPKHISFIFPPSRDLSVYV